MKYSGVKRFSVQLQGAADEIHLTVCDSGTGFDAAAAMNGRGLGLISMRERVTLVKGTISIASKPHGGTEVSVRVPVDVGKDAVLGVVGADGDGGGVSVGFQSLVR